MDPTSLSDSCIDLMTLGLLKALDPIDRVHGPYRFEQEFYRFDDAGLFKALDPIGRVYGPYRFEQQLHRFDDLGPTPCVYYNIKKSTGWPRSPPGQAAVAAAVHILVL